MVAADQLGQLPRKPGQVSLIDCPLAVRPVAGQLDARNGLAILQTLDITIDAAINRQIDAIVTAPVQKSTINDAGVPFTGHTEYLAERAAVPARVFGRVGGSAVVIAVDEEIVIEAAVDELERMWAQGLERRVMTRVA